MTMYSCNWGHHTVRCVDRVIPRRRLACSGTTPACTLSEYRRAASCSHAHSRRHGSCSRRAHVRAEAGSQPSAGGASTNASVAGGDSSSSSETVVTVTTRVYATLAQVWTVLNAFETWARVSPGTTRVERLRLQGGPGSVVVRFRGNLTLPLWSVAGAATVEYREQLPRPSSGRVLLFKELDGTSPAGRFIGKWMIEPHTGDGDAAGGGNDGSSRADGAGAPRCQITLQADLLPRPGMPPLPADTVRRLLAEGVARAVRGVAAAAEALAQSQAGPSWLEAGQQLASGNTGIGGLIGLGYVSTDGISPASAAAVDATNSDGFGPRELWGAAALPLREWAQPQFLGVEAVPLPAIPSASSAVPSSNGSSVTASLPSTEATAEAPSEGGRQPALQEVHLRTLDTTRELHRRAVATMRVAAPVEHIWAALTEWQTHSEFLPGIVDVTLLDVTTKRSSNRDATTLNGRAAPAAFPLGMPAQGDAAQNVAVSRRGRLQYLVARAAPYVALHGVCIMDVLSQRSNSSSSATNGGGAEEQETTAREVQFRVVTPDSPPGLTNMVVRGKWLLSAESSDSDSDSEEDELGGVNNGGPPSSGGMTLLKLAIETRGTFISTAAGTSATTGADAPLSERCVYEELPVLLTAFRARAEALWAESRSSVAVQAAAQARPVPAVFEKAAALAADLPALRAALLAAGLGSTGVMPRREELRSCSSPNATTLEYAISAAGGFKAVASALGWQLSYRDKKPRGYWDRYENVRREIFGFIAENGLEPDVMPSRQTFIEAGRKDLAKLPERWGGTASLAAELGLRPASELGRRATARTLAWQAHVSRVASSTGLTGRALFELAGSTYVPPQNNSAAGTEDDGAAETTEEDLQEDAPSLWMPDWRPARFRKPAAAVDTAGAD